MGINVVRPVIDKINSLFLEDGGDYTAHAQAYMSARVLNPLVAKEMDWRAMHDAVSELRSFGFLAFNGTFMSALQREIPHHTVQQSRQLGILFGIMLRVLLSMRIG